MKLRLLITSTFISFLFFVQNIFSQTYYGDTIWVRDYSGNSANSVAFSPDQTKLAVAYDCLGPMVRVLDVSDGHIIWQSATPDLCLFNIQFSSNGQYIAIAEEQGHLMIVDITIPDTLYDIDTQTGGLNAVDFSVTGDTVYAGGNDGSVRIYETITGTLIHSIPAHSDYVLSIDVSSTGRYLASGSKDNTVKVWDLLNSYQLVYTFTDHSDDVKTVKFTPEEVRLLSGGLDNMIYAYWLPDGSTDTSLSIHSAAVNSIDISSDGSFAISGSTDASVRMTNLNNYDSVSIFTNQLQTQVNGVAISPLMDKMAAASNTGGVILYNIQTLVSAEEPETESFVVYPNPATDFIIISGLVEPAQYEIYNVNGSSINTGTLIGNTINTDQLKPGIYILRVGQHFHSVIKQ